MNIDIPRARVAELEDQLRAIHTAAGDRDLNRGEQTRWNELETELTEMRAVVRDAEAAAARLAAVAADRARWGSLQVSPSTRAALAPEDVLRMRGPQLRDAARAVLDDQRHAAGHLTAAQGDHVAGLLDTANRSTDGSWIATAILLTENPAYRSAWQRVMTDPHAILTGPEAEALRAFQDFRAMSIGTDAAGGYGVPVFIDPTVVLTGQRSLNPFLEIARVETITTDEWKGISSAGVSWSWDAEGDQVSDDTPTLAQPAVPVHSARGFVPFSIELGMDYPNFAREVSGLLADGYAELTAAAFATGSGTGQPTGIVTALDANTNVEVTPTTDGALAGTDINKLWGALPDRAKANATWLMSHDVANEVAAFAAGTTNVNLSFVTTDLTGVVTSLRQRPVRFSSYMPEFSGSTGSASLMIVGDFSRYLIAQRAGMTVEVVPHLFGANGRPTGQRGFFAMARVGADSIDDDSFRLLQNQ